LSGECGGGRGIWGKYWGRRGRKGEEVEGNRKRKKRIGEEKGKWGKRGLSKLIFRQNGRERLVTIHCLKKQRKLKLKNNNRN
jgi:hypothetical protein